MVNPVRPSRVQEKEVQADLAKLEMAEALRHGNVYEVMKRLPAGLTIRDFEDYMSDQWRTFKSQIMQEGSAYESEGSVHEPHYSDFPMHGEGTAMTSEEGNEFMKGMEASLGGSGGFKAMGVKAATADEGAGAEAGSGYSELEGMAEGTLDEWQGFTDEMWNQIFDAQLVEDYEKKMGEIQKDVDRIIALAKSGQADPEYVLIALAKVNVTKNGCLMTWLGKKAFMNNAMMNRVADELRVAGTGDIGAVYDAQAKTRDGAFQQQLVMSDMQKVMQDVAGVLEQVHGIMGEINKTRSEIITKFSAR